MRIATSAARFVAVLLLAACAGHTEWSYEGDTGPEHWGELDEDYAAAKEGQQQSPIDIEPGAAAHEDRPDLSFSYGPAGLDIENNGHSVQVDRGDGGSMIVGDRKFALQQFHFHSPSEHTIDGEHRAMEIHLVHADAEGKLGVLAILVVEGAEHPTLAQLVSNAPASAHTGREVESVKIDPTTLLPKDRDYWTYDGSLTTPPCTEGVSWFVLQQPIKASAEQIAKFQGLMPDNDRPTQPLNDRKVVDAD